jgi:hypothetical protein
MNKKEQNKELSRLKRDFKELLARLDDTCNEAVETLGYELTDEVAQHYVWDYLQDACTQKNLREWIRQEKDRQEHLKTTQNKKN